jgi:hypothetical protein
VELYFKLFSFVYKTVKTSGPFKSWIGNRMVKDHSISRLKYVRKLNGSNIQLSLYFIEMAWITGPLGTLPLKARTYLGIEMLLYWNIASQLIMISPFNAGQSINLSNYTCGVFKRFKLINLNTWPLLEQRQ